MGKEHNKGDSLFELNKLADYEIDKMRKSSEKNYIGSKGKSPKSTLEFWLGKKK